MFDLANPHSIISIHINHSFALSTKRNHYHPIFLPYLTVSDITNHTFLFIDSINNQSFIDWFIIDFQTGIVWFFAFIDSISLLKRNMVIDFVSLESMNEWYGRKRAEAAAATITIVVVVNNEPIYLPMILSTIRTYNIKPF